MQNDVLIMGGGVMGLMSARELAARGLHVTVVDKGAMAGEASWAGGGIVSPLYPWRYKPAVSALVRHSQLAYRALAPALREESGIDPELRCKGLLMLNVADQERALAWAACNGAALTVESNAFARELEPRICATGDEVLWMRDVCSIRNPRLGQALRQSLSRNPRINLMPQTEVSRIERQDQQVVAVHAGGCRLTADRYLLCGGAWSGDLLASLGVALPIEPVKGQMMLFNTGGGLLDRVVLSDGRYLIPRADGRILVGSTLEYTGFEKQVTEEAHDSLFQSAVDILPALKSVPVEAQWAGLRPGSPEGVPFIGAVDGFENLFVNAGHFRNGLVLAPASCRLIAELVCGEPTSIDPAPYALGAPRGSKLL